MTKRFIEFMTQNTYGGELNCGFNDIRTGEWYHTKDRVNAKKCIELLNELDTDCNSLKKENEELKEKYEVCKQAFLDIKDDAIALNSSNMEYEDVLARLEGEKKIICDLNKIQIKNFQDFKHQVHLLIEKYGNDLLRKKYNELIE